MIFFHCKNRNHNIMIMTTILKKITHFKSFKFLKLEPHIVNLKKMPRIKKM